MGVGVQRRVGRGDSSVTLLAVLVLVLAASSSGTAAEIEGGAGEERASLAQLYGNLSTTNKTPGECEFGGQWFGSGDAVPTQEPCLVCTCNVSLVCHLRVCPTVPDATPSGCYKVKTAGQCCPEVVCDGELDGNGLYRHDGENRVKDVLLEHDDHQRHRDAAAAAAAEAAVIGTRRRGGVPDATNTSNVVGCVSDGAVFAEGSAMVSPDECSYCFCIGGKRRCVAPKCILPLEGCRPRYRTFSCCPNFYDCHDTVDFQSTTTTTTTTTDHSIRTCMVDGVEYEDGMRVNAAESNMCESCFCLRGHVSCSNHTCDDPPDAEGCTPIYYEGSCCPVGYTCGDPNDLNQLEYQRESRQGFASEESSPTNDEPVFRNLEGAEEGGVTESTPGEDTTEEIPSSIPVSTSKPPPRLRPMARPSPAELARRRQQSRYNVRRTQPTRIQRPPRPIKTSSESLSLSERLKKRNKYVRTTATPEASTALTSLPSTSSRPSPSPPISTNPTPTLKEDHKPPKITTTTTTFIPNTATTKPYTSAINQPTSTTTTTTTTTTTSQLPPNPTTHKPRRTTTKSEATTRRERPTTTKVPKGTAFRWSKFRYSAAASPTTPRPSSTRALFTFSSQDATATTTTTIPPVRDLWPLSKTTGTGHVGEVFFVQDRKRLTPFAPYATTPPAWQRPVEVGVGVNVKGNLDDATPFGPILIYDNRVRRDRQQKSKNATELTTEEDKVTEVTDAPPTEETTILPEEDEAEEIVVPDSVAASTSNEPLYFEKEHEEVRVTTLLSPAEPIETTIPPQTKSTTPVPQSTPASPVEPAESLLPTTEHVPDAAAAEKPDDTVDIEYLDLDTHIPTYDITVGSSVMTAGHSHLSPVGVGQVIPVKLEPEDLMPHSRPASRPDSKIIIIKKPDHKVTEPEEPSTVTEATESQDQGVSEGETEKPPVQTVTPVVDEASEPEHRQEEGNEELKMEHKISTEGEEILEAEHKTPATESASEAPRPSILSALFNILTQTERPRPDPTRTSRPNPDPPTPEQSGTNESRPTRFRPDRPIPPRLRPEQPGGHRPFRPRPERPGILRPRPDIIRNDHPRPERLPPPSRLPFRPRPRPNGRPDFVPPRFRFTTPAAPSPDTPTEEETTTEPSSPTSVSPAEDESSPTPGLPFRFTPSTTKSTPRLPPKFTPPTTESTPRLPSQFTAPTTESTAQVLPQFRRPTSSEIPARAPPQFVRPTSEGPAPAPFIPPFFQPTSVEPRPGVVNPNPNPIPLFILPDPIHTRPTLRPFIPPPGISSAQPASVSLQGGLPSQPILESGFQGMRKESEGVTPNIDIPEDYDTLGEPTLPPSLPNLKIIPFVAADALTGPDRPFSREDPRSTPRPSLLPILPLKDDHDTDTGEVSTDSPSTTPTTTTITPATTRRPPIIPPRRPQPRPTSGVDATRRPFLPFARPGERSTRPPFKPKPTPAASREDQTTADTNPTLSTRPDILFAFRDRPSSRPPFIPPRRTSSTETTTTTTTTRRPPTTTPSTVHPPSPPPPQPQPSTPFRPKPTTTILPVQTSRPIDSNDISNLLLQDVFQLPPGQSFSVNQGTPKPSRPVKVAAALPEIPAAVRDQLPLATDPVLASGLLKLSGCNIYGRMYVVKDRIPELSAKCKECRCTPVGVQCLPIC